MAFTRRRLTVCVVGAMCASAPPADGFTPPGCFARLPRARDSLCNAAERGAEAAPGYGGGSGGSGRNRQGRGTTAVAAAARCSMASSSRIAAARPGVAARSGAAKAVASAARKRGRDRKQPPFKGPVQAQAQGRAPPVDSSRYEESPVLSSASSGAQRGGDQQQQQLKGEQVAVGAAAAAANPAKKRLRRKSNSKKKKSSSSSSSSSSALPASSTAFTPPPSPAASASSSVDPLGVYFKTLRQIKLLKADEEVVLGRRIQRGLQLERVRDRLEAANGVAPTYEEWAATLNLSKDEMLRELAVADKAKKHMISANLRIVVSMARNYQYRGLAMPDLIQEGTMGLVKATEKFNPEMGFKFYTYATWWIKQSLLTGIANHSRVIRLPTQVHEFLSSIRKYTFELTVNGKLPTDEELGDKIGATVEKIQHYRKAALRTNSVSLESCQGNKQTGGVADELGNQIGDNKNPDPEDASQTFYMKGKVTALLATLKETERIVVRARYGLDGATSKTLEQVGRETGLTRERVRQIEVKALAKLRQPYRNYRVREHEMGQIFVDAGLREPAIEAVDAARALIAEAEGLEKQQPAVAVAAAAAGVKQPVLAAAGDRPLKIEFKPGVDASESTQAVEAVLVAALDRTPTTVAAAAAVGAAAPPQRQLSRDGGGVEPPATEFRTSIAEKPQQQQQRGGVWKGDLDVELGGAAAAAGSERLISAEESQPLVGETQLRSERNGSRLAGAEALPPGSRRGMPKVETKKHLGTNGQGVGSEPERLVEVESERKRGSSVVAVESDSSALSVEPLPVLEVDGVDLRQPAVVPPLAPDDEQRAREIESKRKSLDKAWNKKSEAAVDRLERELAQSAAALALLEMEQEEWERSVGESVGQKSLSMATR